MKAPFITLMAIAAVVFVTGCGKESPTGYSNPQLIAEFTLKLGESKSISVSGIEYIFSIVQRKFDEPVPYAAMEIDGVEISRFTEKPGTVVHHIRGGYVTINFITQYEVSYKVYEYK